MNYRDAIDWIYSARMRGMKLGLENMQHLVAALGSPQRRFRAIHVAGTNGKGSVCAMLEALVRNAGFRTGLYTSPHLLTFRERIQVDRTLISEAEVGACAQQVRDAATGIEPTFFEIATALAFLHFSQQNIEIGIIETGLGGRLDSTNVLMPELCVLTPVGMDHMEWLGDSLASIAAEKAGIIKPGIPALSALQDPVVAEVFQSAASRMAASLDFIPTSPDLPVGLLRGPHQRSNASLALAAAAKLGIPPGTAALAEINWPGRFQEIEPGILLDGAHNVPAAQALVAAWQEAFPGRKASVILGMLADKQARSFLEVLQPIIEELHLVPLSTSRALSTAELAALCPQIPSHQHSTFEAALQAARSSNQPILITGSLYLVGDALRHFTGTPWDGTTNELLTAP